MKSAPWMAVLVVLVFGLGWTSHGVADRVVPEGLAPGGPPARFGDRDGSRFRGPGGSFLRSIDMFADQLELTADQRQEMDRQWTEFNRELCEHDQAVRQLHDETRRDILAVLTTAQKDKYDELLLEPWKRMREAKLASIEAWVRENTTLADPDIAAVVEIFRVAEEEKLKNLTLSRSRGRPPRDDDAGPRDDAHRGEPPRHRGDDEQLQQWREQRDAKLIRYLSQQQIQDLDNKLAEDWKRMWKERDKDWDRRR